MYGLILPDQVLVNSINLGPSCSKACPEFCNDGSVLDYTAYNLLQPLLTS